MQDALHTVAKQLSELSERVEKLAAQAKAPQGSSEAADARKAIEARMVALDWTRYALAERAYASGVSRTVVYEFLAGKRSITSDVMDKLLSILGMSYVVVGKPRDMVEEKPKAKKK